jgi:hypothetical protein
MILADVMEELADALRTISGLKVYGYAGESVTVPAATVRYPTSIDFDASAQRGLDRMEIDIEIAVAQVVSANAPKLVSPYVSGSGPLSVKQTLESFAYTTIHTIRIDRAVFESVDIAGAQYLAGVLTAVITGPGT